jgi:hypothetical protein
MGSDEQFSGPILAHDRLLLALLEKKDLPSLKTWVM